MTRMEELFLKLLREIESGYSGKIYYLEDIRDEKALTSSEYDEVIRWKDEQDKLNKNLQQALVESARAKLTPEEIEAIKKLGV